MKRLTHSSTLAFLSMKTLWNVSPTLQILGIAFLFSTSVFIGLIDIHVTGLHFGYQPSVSIPFAPLYEEILFRGVILGYSLTQMSVARSIIFSSLLFGLWHIKNALFVPPELVLHQILYTTIIVGPLLAIIAVKTQSIWPAVMVHYLHNILAELSRIYSA